MANHRRINLYGGPCSGKSTLCSKLFADLNILGYNIEQIHEYVKSWAWIGRKPKSFDQVYIFSKQLHAEDRILYSGVEHIITDCPLILSIVYSRKYQAPACNHIASIIQEFEKHYPSINIFLQREGIPYHQKGRFQKYEEALEIDEEIENCLNEFAPSYTKIPSKDYSQILEFIVGILNKEN